jgi:hypothetical protein
MPITNSGADVAVGKKNKLNSCSTIINIEAHYKYELTVSCR